MSAQSEERSDADESRLDESGALVPAAVELGDPMRGVVCGTVIESRHPDFAEGDVIAGVGHWADYRAEPKPGQ